MCCCCNAAYYGESERHFLVRTSEQIGMTALIGKQVNNPKKSAVIDNILLTSHDTSFEGLYFIIVF